MKIYALVDWMGTLDKNQTDEYDDIHIRMIEIIGHENFIYKTNVFPHQMKNDKVDIFIMDFGGVMPGCEDTVQSHYRSLLEAIQEKPNTLFVIYSLFTERWYERTIEKYFPEFIAPNVVYFSDDDSIDKIRSWLDIK